MNTAKISARSAAITILSRWQGSGQPIDGIFNTTSAHLNRRDRHLVTTMVYGVLRQQEYLDFIITRFAKHPLTKMTPLTLMGLRTGIFQLLLLDRIPDSAAVNETVKALKGPHTPTYLIRFVNGVLRNVARSKSSLPRPEEARINGRPILNHPAWLTKRWQREFGTEKCTTICRINNETPHLVLRTNTKRIARDELLDILQANGCTVIPGRYAENAIIVHSLVGPIAELPGYEEGFFQVQDEAAQLAGQILTRGASAGRYADACAGLGGKTSHLAQELPETASIVAIEPDQRRYSLLMENLQRLNLAERVTPVHGRLETYHDTDGFDGILLDAPCSGTGVIRRHPDIRWNREEIDLQGYQQQQIFLLDQAVSLLKPDGVIVYATCSMEPEENEEVVAHFLRTHSSFSLADCRDVLPAPAASLVDAAGFFHPTPNDGIDGFFAARIVSSGSL